MIVDIVKNITLKRLLKRLLKCNVYLVYLRISNYLFDLNNSVKIVANLDVNISLIFHVVIRTIFMLLKL